MKKDQDHDQTAITHRKQAEDELRTNEDCYRLLIEAADRSGQAIIITQDINEMEAVCVFSNETALEITGYSHEELSTHSWLDIVHPCDRDAATQRARRRMLGESFPGINELSIIRKDGTEVCLEIFSIRSKFFDATALFTFFRDITVRKSAETALGTSEERYRILIEKMTNGFALHEIICSRDGKPIDYLFLELNPAFEEMTGLDASLVIGKTVSEVLPQAEPYWLDTYGKVALTGESIRFENYSKELLKYFEVFAYSPKTGQFATVFTDITDRKNAEKALTESEERFRLLSESSFEGIIITERGVVLEANDQFAAMHGYEHSETIGMAALGFVAPESREMVMQKIKSGYQEPYEHFALKKDGTPINVEVRNQTIPEEGRNLIVTTIRDVTERKHLEEQLLHSQKMECIGTLAGGVAHDFNNILGIILGNTELAIHDTRERSPVRYSLAEIQTACFRAKDVIQQLLSFSRKAEPEKKPVKVSLLIKESLKLLRSSMPAGIEIRQHLSNTSDTIIANATQIHQVIINLCTNAAHAMEENGGVLEILLTQRTVTVDEAFRYRNLKPGHYVLLSVSDTGHGIEPGNLNRIFDPYFTTKEIGRGSGMGLSVIHGIAINLGGNVSVVSTPDKGSTFHVFFPAADTEPLPAPEPSDNLLRGNEKILFVDDEKGVATIGCEILQRLGYHTISKTNPIEAMELLHSDPNGFDLVITDMSMPHITGDKLAEDILKTNPNLPVILCSGHNESTDESMTRWTGIRAFVQKPVSMHQLAKTVRNVLDEENLSR